MFFITQSSRAFTPGCSQSLREWRGGEGDGTGNFVLAFSKACSPIVSQSIFTKIMYQALCWVQRIQNDTTPCCPTV